MKEKHCVLCPHCGKAIEVYEGCPEVVCGRDADDKGGGNRQNGCFKKFNTLNAKRYTRGNDVMKMPKELWNVDLSKLNNVVFHYLMPLNFQKPL